MNNLINFTSSKNYWDQNMKAEIQKIAKISPEQSGKRVCEKAVAGERRIDLY
jgi:hypothetical protein